MSYSFQKDVPTIQELKSHSLDNQLRNSKLIGPEGKNDLYQFTIKNHDGTVITEDRIKSPWPLTIQESDAEKEVKAEMEAANNNTKLKNDAQIDDTPSFLKGNAQATISDETAIDGEHKSNGIAGDDDTPAFLKDDAPGSKIDAVEAQGEKILIDENDGGIGGKTKNNYNTEAKPKESKTGDSAPPNAKGTKEEIPKASGTTETGYYGYAEQPKPSDPLRNSPAIIPEGKQEIPETDGEAHAGSGSENGNLDGSKEYTAERKLKNVEKVLDEHKIDYSNMSEEEKLAAKRNLKKDYWNKRKAALGGHGKAALAVGTAVAAGSLVLGLSNSRGQQSNAQLYGQQPLSY